MLVLKAESLKKEWNGKWVFEDVHLEVEQGERVALIGRNGVGKTTLLGCLTGRISPEGGTIYRRWPAERWGMVEQQLKVPGRWRVRDFVESGNPELFRLKRERIQLEQRMADGAEEPLDEHIARYGSVLERFQLLGGYEWEQEVEAHLTRFRLPGEALFHRLSGGQKTRAQLARALMGDPPFLLLDEPTNHLDVETADWLGEWIRSYRGTVLFVSHDREWIDRLADKTVELTPQGTRTYKGGYSDFQRERERERKEQEALYRKQQQQRGKLEEAIRRYREWYAKAHSNAGERNPYLKKRAEKNRTRFQAKERALERLEKEKVERPQSAPQVKVRFEGSGFEAHHLVRLEETDIGYGGEPVLREVTLTLSRGDRMAVIGPNGSGKTTLLKLLAGKLEARSGNVIRHPALQVGYFAQELDSLKEDETILESLLRLPGMTQGEARNILAAFLFRRDEVHRKIGSLSMGERCRVAFVNLYFSEANLMVLDEPTNYLDIPTRERIEEALLQYPGAMVLVSHDRALLKKVSNRVAVLKDGRVETYPGGYPEYLMHLKERAHPADPETDRRIRALELELSRLMAEDEPETEEARDSLYARIREIRAELMRLKESFQG
ncbi:MAG: ribosomal protection-like ABC-F family protein [Planifilum sp.]|jgi:ATP-binding cassette subfamily F protein 3